MKWKFPYYDIEKGYDWEGLKKFDWFTDMELVEQDLIWYAEGNVMIHTKMVCEALINLPEFKQLSDDNKHILATSALFHDVEKRSTTTTKEKDGRICVVAPKHALYGSKTVNKVLYKDIPTPFNIRRKITKYVEFHGVPLFSGSRLTKNMIKASETISIYMLGMLSKADVLGRTCVDQNKLLEDIEFFKLHAEEMGCLDTHYSYNLQYVEQNGDLLHRYMYLGKNKPLTYIPFPEKTFTVHMISGIAGSGKDTYIKANLSELPVVSLDDIRRENKIKPTDKKGNGRVIQMGKEACKVNLRQKKSFVFNATNITKDMRQKWVSLFEEYGGLVNIHYIDTPYKTLLEQNKNREYAVPEKVIEKMINKLEIPSYDEAYDLTFKIN